MENAKNWAFCRQSFVSSSLFEGVGAGKAASKTVKEQDRETTQGQINQRFDREKPVEVQQKTVWTKCYSERWPGELLAESVVHPAKYARELIRRIYAYCVGSGLLKTGDTVLDPFGGVGLGAFDALTYGLNWVGVEIEPMFVAMGRGIACEGISRQDWVRFFGRWKRAVESGERQWCPRCLAEAERVVEPQPMLLPPSPTAAYARSSGKVPFSGGHLYEGNLQRFSRYARHGAQARIIQGDSRRLVEVLAGKLETVEAVISSPPYESSINQHPTANDTQRRLDRMKRAGIDVSNRANVGGNNGVARQAQNYGTSAGQLGAEAGDNFWEAARQVLEQCHTLLAPGGVAVWVVKDYVQNGQRVEFSRQWRELCEACGFEHLGDVLASFVEGRGRQMKLDGQVAVKQIERKSFFRRLAERNGSPAINEEAIIFTRKRAI